MDLSKATWRKASQSNDSGDACIEVASVPHAAVLRDSKDPEGPKLFVTRAQARALSTAIKKL
ncbi:DUF397 domain-containing protein [Spirillospora sp. NPDC050679]